MLHRDVMHAECAVTMKTFFVSLMILVDDHDE